MRFCRGADPWGCASHSPGLSLTDDELETVMQRLDDAFEHGADVSVVHDVVRELMEEKRASRQVTVPAVMLEKVMALAGSEMKRLYAVGSDNGATVTHSSGGTRSNGRCVTGAGRGAHVMNISTETREILRNYKAVINARRREMGQKPLTTAQIVDEICDFVANQQAVFRRSLHPSGQQKQVIQGRRWRPPVSPRENPGRLAPAGNGCSACGAAGPAFRSEGSVWLYAGNRCDIP